MLGQRFRKQKKKKKNISLTVEWKAKKIRKIEEEKKIKAKEVDKERKGIVWEVSVSSREGTKNQRDIMRRIKNKNVIEEKSAGENRETKEEDEEKKIKKGKGNRNRKKKRKEKRKEKRQKEGAEVNRK
jgi:hypothetical protein